ncbi:unnamed protein product [Pleuronectes platessa]|uniref:Uncharacterized protein n=1 Tax=Pleuronectes platessa TaxID=8262 RepID=A0A9N7UGV5_PLEPL|nr:unnamed protein product [Pleuronectes platessa]
MSSEPRRPAMRLGPKKTYLRRKRGRSRSGKHGVVPDEEAHFCSSVLEHLGTGVITPLAASRTQRRTPPSPPSRVIPSHYFGLIISFSWSRQQALCHAAPRSCLPAGHLSPPHHVAPTQSGICRAEDSMGGDD